jgi:hypothetical protein
MVELLADAVERALGPGTTSRSSAKDVGPQEDVSKALNLYLDQEVEAIKVWQKELES